MNNPVRLVSIGCIILLAFTYSAPTFAIKKCQDANGKWHYGDFAVAACNESKVTTLDKRGNVKAEREAPLTKEELAAKAEQERAEQERLEQEQAEREERQRVLSIYETEADIERQRDNQIYSVESNIAVTQAYINSLQDRIERNMQKLNPQSHPKYVEKIEGENLETRSKIETAEQQLVELNEQKTAVEARFERELELYRKLREVDDSDV